VLGLVQPLRFAPTLRAPCGRAGLALRAAPSRDRGRWATGASGEGSGSRVGWGVQKMGPLRSQDGASCEDS